MDHGGDLLDRLHHRLAHRLPHSQHLRVVDPRLCRRGQLADAAAARSGGGVQSPPAARLHAAHALEPAQSRTGHPSRRPRFAGAHAGGQGRASGLAGGQRQGRLAGHQPVLDLLPGFRPDRSEERGQGGADRVFRNLGRQQPQRHGQRAALSRRTDRQLRETAARRRDPPRAISRDLQQRAVRSQCAQARSASRPSGEAEASARGRARRAADRSPAKWPPHRNS